MPGERISQAHGTMRPVDPESGATSAMAFALYHPAAALRTPDIERTSYADVARIPAALLESRARREPREAVAVPVPVSSGPAPSVVTASAAPDAEPDFTLF
jgi:hypothetical protein